MSDNVDVSEGSGKTVAADDVGGVMFQRVKVNFGVDGSATDVSDSDPLPVVFDTSEALEIVPSTSDSAIVTSVNSSASSQQAIAANTSRRGLFMVNTDANAALVKLGLTASATSYTVRLIQNAYYELPEPVYTGRIDVIWESDGSGALILTELE